jgi:hypothetical protein
MKLMKLIVTGIGVALLFLIQSCGVNQLEPFDAQPTLTKAPPTVLAIPTIAATLPPLPDFGQVLGYGGGGGGGGTCMENLLGSGVYARRWQDGGHVAELCVFDTAMPVNVPIHVELTSPDKSIVLRGDIQSSSGEQSVYWLGFENEFNYSYISDCDEKSCLDWGIEFWWPTDLSDGDWQVDLSWDGGEVLGTFQTDGPVSLPEFSVHDALVTDALRPSTLLYPCHPVESDEGLIAVGRGFPANATVYVPIFEQEVSTKYNYLTAEVFTADADGNVYGDLTADFQAGKKYVLGGVTDSTLPLVTPDGGGFVSFGSLKEAVDCFYIP